jgi:hypothetical protein
LSKPCSGQINRLAESRTFIEAMPFVEVFRWHESCLPELVMTDIRW